MIRSGRFALGIALVLAACQPASYVAYDSWDYDFRYDIYDDYWDNADINRPDRPTSPDRPQPPADLGPRPTPPIYIPSDRPSVQPLPSNRSSSVRSGGSAGRTGGAGSLRGSRR